MNGDTRTALLDAALGLFAAQGVELPSMREITRAAEQRNTNALQYHFRDREGLLRDLLDRHGAAVDHRRNVLLDELEVGDDQTLRPLAAALVLPLAALLSEGGSGREYLQLTAELLARPVHFSTVVDRVTLRPSLVRWGGLVEPFLPAQAVGRPLHRRFTAIRFVHNELGSRAKERQSRADHRLFTSHLIDVVCGLVTAPVSAETSALIDA
jgi:AcrR family transcriptional regulator